MVQVLLLVLTVLDCAAQNVLKKYYTNRVPNGVFTFTMLVSFSSMLLFLALSGGQLHFNGPTLIYGALFALTYAMAVFFSQLALQYGPLSVTSLVVSYSLVLPTLLGIWILKEPVKLTLLIGIALLLISLWLINRRETGTVMVLTPKWMVTAALAFVGNGVCSFVQKYHQTLFDGQYKSEFMGFAMFLTGAMALIGMLVTERKELKSNLKQGGLIAVSSGLANGFSNLMVMILSAVLAASVLFPIISAGSIVMTFFVSLFWFREKLTGGQLIGVALGIGSVIALSL